MKVRKFVALATAAVAVSAATAAQALVTFDPATGTGFVGKGDVQEVYGWSNRQLQDNANSVQFRALTTTVTEQSWECTNANNQKVQERERTTTNTVGGVLSSIARERNQITGFILTGYGSSVVAGTSSEGPKLNSCPNANGTWSLTKEAGAPEVVSSDSTFQVSTGGAWTDLH